MIPGIQTFFYTLYPSPKIEAQSFKKWVIYSVPSSTLQISLTTNNYRACHVEVIKISSRHFASFKQAVAQLCRTFQEKRSIDSLWIKLKPPLSMQHLGALIPDSFMIGHPEKGDLISNTHLTIWQWLNLRCKPPAHFCGSHDLRTAALIIDSAMKKVLMIVETRLDDTWVLPDTDYDPQQNPTKAALEALEKKEDFR